MAITDFDSYSDMQDGPRHLLHVTKNTVTIAAGKPGSFFLANPFGGSAPTSAVVPTAATTGAMNGFQSGGSNPLRITKAVFSGPPIHTALWLIDRLSHQGGLDATSTSGQTTNLPTAALTRYTNGVGVWAALQIYTAIGTTATTFTCSYTNQAGTGSRTSVATDIGGTANNALSRYIIMPLQEGDTGVRSVESVTLAASTTTVGNFGVVLFKPLMIFPIIISGAQQREFDPLLNLCANLPEIDDNACLDWLAMPNTTGTGAFQASLYFSEDI